MKSSYNSPVLEGKLACNDGVFSLPPAPNASICQPMNTTCCKPRMEKIITKVAEKEYGELFLNVTHESIRSCLEVGRLFYRKCSRL